MTIVVEKIAVLGLGYVGLPVAVALAEKFPGTVGFDISSRRVNALQKNVDWTGEVEAERLKKSGLHITDKNEELQGCSLFIVTVPTPINAEKRPDLSPLDSACRIIGPYLTKGALVVFESTVYPGVTEEFCAPLLDKYSGLSYPADFHLGYSPERINPGDKLHRLDNITKIIAADSASAIARLRHVYGSIVNAGLHEAPSIKVAEAAKVLENTQRDINISLMNELALILERLNIRTADVLEAAGTKWNFLRFTPGLVGGHCIGVDPYYLTACAEAQGYTPQVILAGRRVNDDMARFIATKTLKLLLKSNSDLAVAKVGILGLTFKENVPDIRNSKVPDIERELREFGIQPLIHDPLADEKEAYLEYGIRLSGLDAFNDLQAVIVAVNHATYLGDVQKLIQMLKPGGILVDVKSAIPPSAVPAHINYWSL